MASTEQLLTEISTSVSSVSSSADGPIFGTPVYLAIGLTSAETVADLAAGEYLLTATTDVCFRINAAGGGAAAVWCTAPAIYMQSGDTRWLRLTAAKRIAAIALEATQYLMILPVT